ncbi:MAG: sulfotransferase family protein [Thermoguttaceae bacterium]
MARTLILLSAKRCGSTAVFQMFRRHPDVGICHVQRDIENWEPNFWNLAWEAISGNPAPLVARLAASLPFLRMPSAFTEQTVFELWDTILARQGPIVFEKSPQYLGNRPAIDLLYRYKALGRDVRVFALIRDPRDAISSQYELWHRCAPADAPEKRKAAWLDQYAHLEQLRRRHQIPLVRYEDLASRPEQYAPMLYRFCGLRDVPATYRHLRPTSINRYSMSRNPRIRRWKMSPQFIQHLTAYGYRVPQLGSWQKAGQLMLRVPRLVFRRAA